MAIETIDPSSNDRHRGDRRAMESCKSWMASRHLEKPPIRPLIRRLRHSGRYRRRRGPWAVKRGPIEAIDDGRKEEEEENRLIGRDDEKEDEEEDGDSVEVRCESSDSGFDDYYWDCFGRRNRFPISWKRRL